MQVSIKLNEGGPERSKGVVFFHHRAAICRLLRQFRTAHGSAPRTPANRRGRVSSEIPCQSIFWLAQNYVRHIVVKG